MELERRITNAKTISTPETATAKEKPATMTIDHPEVKPMSKEVRKAREETDRCVMASYIPKAGEILINEIKTPREGAVTLAHEFMHHILTKCLGEEASKRFDTSGLGHYLDNYLFPDLVDCLFCEHYSPSTLHADEGICGGVRVKSGWSCPSCELSPVFKKLPFTEYKTWVEYRRGDIEQLPELVKSKNKEVAEHYRKEVEEWKKSVQECPNQFKLDCKHLAADCFPPYCLDDCTQFEKLEEARG